ncbi:histidine kinase [Geomonas sp. Red276]
MSKLLKVLLVEDSPEDGMLLLRELKRGGYQPQHRRVESSTQMREALKADTWDVILSDYHLPGFDALGALRVLHDSGHDLPFIIISGKIGEDLAVAAMKSGAHDYLMKDNLTRLIPVVERELREASERRVHRITQEEVVRAKAEWEAVFNAVSDLIFITDSEGIVERCNRRASDYFGGYGQVLGRWIDTIFFGEGEPAQKVFRFVHMMGNEIEEDVTFPNLKGWYNVASYPMQFEHGRSGYVFIIKDITKRREVEEEKRTTDRELLTMYAVAFKLKYTQGLAKLTGELLFQLHNMLQMEFSFIHLYRKERLVMQGSLGLSGGMDAAMRSLPKTSQWSVLTQKGKPFEGNGADDRFPPRARIEGQEMGVHSWCCVPIMVGQEVVGAMTVGTRSERVFNPREVFLLSSIAGQYAVLVENYNLYDQMKEKADELYRSKEELKVNLQKVKRANIELGRLNTAKNNFIGIASHELKTPITSIMGGAEFLLKYSGLQMTPEQQSILASVYEGAVQLRKLVEDLLSISRIETQGSNPQKRPVNLVQLAREAHDLFILPLSERHIAVNVSGDESPVPVDEAFALLAVKNLLENAIKFTPDGGTVVLSGKQVKSNQVKGMAKTLKHFYGNFPANLAQTDNYYLFQVKDSGIGIPEEERMRIFDKFYGVGEIEHHTSGTTAFMSKGSGLGLSIVRGIMEVHQGAVWVESEEGKGSTFFLLFPV